MLSADLRTGPTAARFVRVCCVVASSAVAVACSDRISGVLVPYPEPVQGTSVVSMLVATTRGEHEDSAQMFSGERGTRIGFADISVSIPPDANRKVGQVQWPRSLPGDPQREFVTVGAEFIDEPTLAARFHERLQSSPSRHTLVFVHGYNNEFEDAVFRYAQVVHDSGAEVVPIMLTWPSRGKLKAYNYDRESANYSRDALEEVLRRLSADKSVSEITLLAHSMGNWLALEALRQMAIRDGRISAKIKNVMLAAPDVDVDVFRTQIQAIGQPKPHFTLFVSKNDKALRLSKRLWGSTSRLGAIDPLSEPYRTQMQREGIVVVDLTNTNTTDRMHHSTFAESEVVRLIGRQIAEGQDLSAFEVGASDITVSGSAHATTASPSPDR